MASANLAAIRQSPSFTSVWLTSVAPFLTQTSRSFAQSLCPCIRCSNPGKDWLIDPTMFFKPLESRAAFVRRDPAKRHTKANNASSALVCRLQMAQAGNSRPFGRRLSGKMTLVLPENPI
jgi:hypothetical protein